MNRIDIFEFFSCFSTQSIEEHAASSERIHGNDSEGLDHELEVDDTDLLLPDLDGKEPSGSGGTQSAEVTTNGNENEDASASRQMPHMTDPVHMNNSPIRAHAHQTENEKETDSIAEDVHEVEAQNEADPQPEKPKDAADTLSLDLDDDLGMFMEVGDGDVLERYFNS